MRQDFGRGMRMVFESSSLPARYEIELVDIVLNVADSMLRCSIRARSPGKRLRELYHTFMRGRKVRSGRSKGVDFLCRVSDPTIIAINMHLTSFDISSCGSSLKSSSTTCEAMTPPWECARRTSFLTLGSTSEALT